MQTTFRKVALVADLVYANNMYSSFLTNGGLLQDANAKFGKDFEYGTLLLFF